MPLIDNLPPRAVVARPLKRIYKIYFLRRSLREGHVDRRGLVMTAAIALSILLLGVPLLWFLTGN